MFKIVFDKFDVNIKGCLENGIFKNYFVVYFKELLNFCFWKLFNVIVLKLFLIGKFLGFRLNWLFFVDVYFIWVNVLLFGLIKVLLNSFLFFLLFLFNNFIVVILFVSLVKVKGDILFDEINCIFFLISCECLFSIVVIVIFVDNS